MAVFRALVKVLLKLWNQKKLLNSIVLNSLNHHLTECSNLIQLLRSFIVKQIYFQNLTNRAERLCFLLIEGCQHSNYLLEECLAKNAQNHNDLFRVFQQAYKTVLNNSSSDQFTNLEDLKESIEERIKEFKEEDDSLFQFTFLATQAAFRFVRFS